MPPTGEVQLTIVDGALGSVTAPPANVQAVIGCSSSGTSQQILSTTQKTALVTAYGYGPLVEAAALVCEAGGTVLAIKVPSNTTGLVTGSNAATTAVTGATTATPIVVSSTSHGLTTGDVVTTASIGGMTEANGTFVVTVITSGTFSLNGSVGSGTYTSGGTVQKLGTSFLGTGTSVMTESGAPYDAYQMLFTVTTGGTRGTAGIKFTLSLDNGRTTGPEIALGTATSYAIAQTGMTLNFAAGTLVAGDTFRFSTTPPVWSVGDVTTALATLQASTNTFGGGVHIVGAMTGTNASTIQANLITMQAAFRYTFGLIEARDNTAGESEATWMASVEADYASVSGVRLCAGAGHVDIRSPIKGSAFGAPNYRRPLTWGAAVRTVEVPIHVHIGRVRDGALDGVTGPGTAAYATDGYIYHDERVTPGFDTNRLMAARTIIGRPGVYIKNPNMLAPNGSDFTILPYRRIMDVACQVTHDTMILFINDTVRLDPVTGHILEKDARAIESALTAALRNNLVSPGHASNVSAVVSRVDDINSTKILTATVRILALGFILEEQIDIGFQPTPSTAT